LAEHIVGTETNDNGMQPVQQLRSAGRSKRRSAGASSQTAESMVDYIRFSQRGAHAAQLSAHTPGYYAVKLALERPHRRLVAFEFVDVQ